MKKVVVFGGSGFIGSHTADILTKKGYLVSIFDIKPSQYISPNQEMVIGDILNRNQVEQATEGVDFVYNFSGIANNWHSIVDKYPSVEIVNDHILQLATRADFVISFWGSGAMDCYLLGVPVIEYWDPNKHHKSQVYEGSGYTTIYRKLGIVRHANNEEKLKKEISSLMSENYKICPDGIHPFFSKLTTRSNQWNKAIEKILLSNNLINNGAFYN